MGVFLILVPGRSQLLGSVPGSKDFSMFCLQNEKSTWLRGSRLWFCKFHATIQMQKTAPKAVFCIALWSQIIPRRHSEFSRPRLAVCSAEQTSLRLTQVQKKAEAVQSFSSCVLGRNRTYNYPLGRGSYIHLTTRTTKNTLSGAFSIH